jgi:hypothetical protein
MTKLLSVVCLVYPVSFIANEPLPRDLGVTRLTVITADPQ